MQAALINTFNRFFRTEEVLDEHEVENEEMGEALPVDPTSVKNLMAAFAKADLPPSGTLFSHETYLGPKFQARKTEEGFIVENEQSGKTVLVDAEGNLFGKEKEVCKIAAWLYEPFHLIFNSGQESRKCPLLQFNVPYKDKEVPYVVGKTNSGIVIQKHVSYYHGKRDGLYVGNDGTIHFDGDPDILAALQQFYATMGESQEIAKNLQLLDGEEHRFTLNEIEYSLSKTKTGFTISSEGKCLIASENGCLKINDEVYDVKNSPAHLQAFLHQAMRLVRFEAYFSCYFEGFKTEKNWKLLRNYFLSPQFTEDARTACVFYNGAELKSGQAMRVMKQREPVNMDMEKYYYPDRLKALLGFEESVFNDMTVMKEKGVPYRSQPNTVCPFSMIRIWPNKRVAQLAIPAPALDQKTQPHYRYYVQEGKLNEVRYETEMEHLARTICTALLSKREENGIKRLVLSKYGQNNFTRALSDGDKVVAKDKYYTTLTRELIKHQEEIGTDFPIRMSIYRRDNDEIIELNKHFIAVLSEAGFTNVKIMVGDILEKAKEGDMITVPWDPHANGGNGGPGDRSFDGTMGDGSSLPVAINAFLNFVFNALEKYIPVRAPRQNIGREGTRV